MVFKTTHSHWTYWSQFLWQVIPYLGGAATKAISPKVISVLQFGERSSNPFEDLKLWLEAFTDIIIDWLCTKVQGREVPWT